MIPKRTYIEISALEEQYEKRLAILDPSNVFEQKEISRIQSGLDLLLGILEKEEKRARLRRFKIIPGEKQ